MKRRSFIQSLLAIPVVAAVAKYLPASAQPEPFNPYPPPLTDNLFLKKPLFAYQREPVYKWTPALAGIRKGDMLREFQFGGGVLPMDGEPGGWFAGVAMHDAMAGEMIKVMVEGQAKVNL